MAQSQEGPGERYVPPQDTLDDAVAMGAVPVSAEVVRAFGVGAEPLEEAGGGFAVEPKSDCPHIFKNIRFPKNPEEIFDVKRRCESCDPESHNHGENWINLKDWTVQCSRYHQGHALKHWEEIRSKTADNNNGCIVVSFADLSFFCYACDSYIQHPALNPIRDHLCMSKFGERPEGSGGASDLSERMAGVSLEESGEEEEVRPADLPPPPTVEDIARGIRSGEFKNIVVLSGAGLSTAAGIPDFRSPGTGLYDNLAKYNLPHPTAVFEIEFFKSHPEPFYALAKELLPGKFKPTLGHIFLRLLSDKGILLRNYTQNIDNLELMAGIPSEKCIDCHGSFKSACCAECRQPYDVDVVKASIAEGKVLRCSTCDGPVKPGIVFFGEALPRAFGEFSEEDMEAADLLIVIGTSLRVSPVRYLPFMAGENVKRIFINRESLLDRVSRGKWNTTDVEMLGDLQQDIMHLVVLMGWQEEFSALYKSILGEDVPAGVFEPSSSASSS